MKKEIRKLLRQNTAALEQSPRDFESIYEITFSNAERILGEENDGFRIRCHSYTETKGRIEQVSSELYRRLGAGHRYIGLEMENSMEWIIAFWAILRSGNKPYLVNCRHPKSLSDRLLKQLDIQWVISTEQSRLDAQTLLFSELEQGEICPAAFENEIAFSTSATSMNEVICFYTGAEIAMGILNVHGIIKQSPRMAAHYHGKLKHLAFLPFYHVFGLVAVLFWFSFFGRTLVFLRNYAPDTILRTCRKHEVTHIFAVPMLWHTVEKQILRQVREQGKEEKFRRGLALATRVQELLPHKGAALAARIMGQVTKQLFGPSVRFCISGGSALRPSALKLMNALGYPLHNGYGMSEIGITSVELRKRPSQRNENSIGRPFDSVEYRIAADGTLQVRGGSICKKMLVNGELRHIDGWFSTGDCMEQRNGNYFIRGRMGDMVLGENGENINPDVIEEQFRIMDAQALCVLGLRQGEEEVLSMVVQLNPYLSGERIDGLIEELYRSNEAIDSASRVRQFWFTHDPIAPETAVKVGRKYLLQGIERGSIRLSSAAELKQAHHPDEALCCNAQLYAAVRRIVAEELDLPEEKIGPNDHVIFDLGGSSLQYFAILSALAEKFSVGAPSDQETYRYTLKEFCQYIERHI